MMFKPGNYIIINSKPVEINGELFGFNINCMDWEFDNKTNIGNLLNEYYG